MGKKSDSFNYCQLIVLYFICFRGQQTFCNDLESTILGLLQGPSVHATVTVPVFLFGGGGTTSYI